MDNNREALVESVNYIKDKKVIDVHVREVVQEEVREDVAKSTVLLSDLISAGDKSAAAYTRLEGKCAALKDQSDRREIWIHEITNTTGVALTAK